MQLAGKNCSRCGEFKSLSDFYRQGQRHESLCKECKRKARAVRSGETGADGRPSDAEARRTSVVHAPPSQPVERDAFERETMPVFDESIFDPEAEVRKLGFSSEDIDAIVAYFRWFIEQGEKQKGEKKA